MTSGNTWLKINSRTGKMNKKYIKIKVNLLALILSYLPLTNV